MPNFLLWNVNRRSIDALVLALVESERIDVVMLVERARLTVLADLLGARSFRAIDSHDRFGVFAKDGFRMTRLSPSTVENRADYFRLTPPLGADGLIALIHGPDRRNSDDQTRAAVFRQVQLTVQFLEGRSGHRRTIVTGDFNAHPFEPAVVSANGLHAIGSRRVRGRTTRRVAGSEHAFFYNPMWRVYGHGADAGAATHHYVGNGAVELAWHMLDQVVVRPDAADLLPEDRIRIVTTVGGISLVNDRGVPDDRNASDHLPLLFTWNL